MSENWQARQALLMGEEALRLLEEGKVEVDHVCTEDQLADILTKSLGKQKFLEMRKRIGVAAVK